MSVVYRILMHTFKPTADS